MKTKVRILLLSSIVLALMVTAVAARPLIKTETENGSTPDPTSVVEVCSAMGVAGYKIEGLREAGYTRRQVMDAALSQMSGLPDAERGIRWAVNTVFDQKWGSADEAQDRLKLACLHLASPAPGL